MEWIACSVTEWIVETNLRLRWIRLIVTRPDSNGIYNVDNTELAF